MEEILGTITIIGWIFAYFFATSYRDDISKLMKECETKIGRRVEFY